MVQSTPEVGDRLADRYRLVECIDKSDASSTWRANDEKLLRPVGIHILPTDQDLAEAVVTAARAAATLDDGRFLRVLDAVTRGNAAYVIYEWLPEVRTLSAALAADGPLEPAVAQRMITDAAEALSNAHEVGLSHLRLQADTVLLTKTGQVKILGLCVEAALHSTSAGDPARSDARGLGRVLYAALTGRWPEGEAFGLPAAPYEHGAICTPRQVRAGVPDNLDAIVDRLLNPNPRTGTALRTPDELATVLRQLPRPRPPTSGPAPETGPMSAVVTGILSPMPTSTGWKPSAATRGAQVAVIGMLVIGLALLSWQLLRALAPEGLGGEADKETVAPLVAIKVVNVDDFDPQPKGNGSENPDQARLAVDGRPGTSWRTAAYKTVSFGGLKPGVGLVLDLGGPQTVRQVRLRLPEQGASVEIRTAGVTATQPPDALASYLVAASRSDAGTEETLRFSFAAKTRFVLIWITQLPPGAGPTYRGGIAEVTVSG